MRIQARRVPSWDSSLGIKDLDQDQRFLVQNFLVVTEEGDPVFLLWGKEAQGKEELITRITGSPGKIIKSSHPSPASAYRPCLDSPPFIESKPFSKANDLLRGSRRGEIDWNLAP